ncbi:MAG: glycosyltransferase family 2 protein [Thermoplasmata archaeon]|nr:MAG: glycosyltransferase family 2 protein [Thermoplasmata archaeon]
MTELSVVIPTLNEELSIGEVIDSLHKVLKNFEYEILIVDGLSTDKTVKISKSKGAKVVMEKRKGYGRAYKTGFKTAKGELIATMDGDLTYPDEVIPDLIKRLRKEKLDFITCDRLSQLDKSVMSKKHRLGNWILTKTGNVLFRIKLADNQSGMWIFRRAILKKLNLTSDGMGFSEEIKIETFRHKDIKAIEVAVPYRMRVGEVKLDTWGDGWNNLKFLFRKRFRSEKAQ